MSALPCHKLLRRVTAGLGVFVLGFLAACGPATLPPGDSIPDADEAQNRAVHQFNIALDRTLVRPAARGYGTAVPEPIRQGIDNVAGNLSQPSYILNNLLQVRLGQASQNTLRFIVNSTVGIGGVFDPVTALGLPAQQTDFGETLHVWGLPEGDFVMLPVFGPSTTRDSVGSIVDIATNPLRQIVPPQDRVYVSGVRVLDRFGDRYRAFDALGSVLDDSADSYAQLRSLYLQNRRFALGGSQSGGGGADGDVYADPYGGVPETTPVQGGADPFSELYVDPYAR
jgi:phospholipid-binding lipoprotein MlaA